MPDRWKGVDGVGLEGEGAAGPGPSRHQQGAASHRADAGVALDADGQLAEVWGVGKAQEGGDPGVGEVRLLESES